MLFTVQDLGNSNNEFSKENYIVLLWILTFQHLLNLSNQQYFYQRSKMMVKSTAHTDTSKGIK